MTASFENAYNSEVLHMVAYSLTGQTDMRLLTPEHAEELYRLTEDNRPFLRQWFSWVDAVHSAYDSRAYIDDLNRRHRVGDAYGYGLFDGSALVGVMELSGVNSPDKSGRIGYWLSESGHGKGRMTRACDALTDYAFERCGLNRVAIQVAADNSRGRAVPERLGYTLEGTLRQAKLLNDRFVDMAVYSILAAEWAEMDRMSKNVGY